ncbi:glycosyltransferase [Methylicorpusculum oleiharenae]|uniref:glycosyltransferase family protein n=1 Tax=Methylicorpusculum oleiharenae TaxID=1338687 RepID=UPI00135C7B4D|nr:glycosyltransferase [Methylicorpusculum oleiharenae]MCD2449152.1 glycosyltransferase [Methylicorpusculum oleiharenae]
MRVVHIAYQQLRRYGKSRVSWARKLTQGLIKNDHFVEVFSDRDVAAFEAPFGIRDLGIGKANKRLLETIDAVEPDLVIAGHCDIISNDTLQEIRRRHPEVVIAHCNNDPLFVPENVERIKHRAAVVDAVFVSTGSRELVIFEGLRARVYHMPNPVDPSIENLDNSIRNDLPIDLLFCSNATAYSKRLESVKWLKEKLDNECNFKIYGSFGEPPVWGREYDRVLAQTKMGLNFNRQEGYYWYSSARMAQLAGNGILQFTHCSNGFDELLPPESLVYFDEQEDLLDRIREFNADNAKRQAWAARAREFFHAEMNSQLFAQYIVEASLQKTFSHDYVWARDIRPDGRTN